MDVVSKKNAVSKKKKKKRKDTIAGFAIYEKEEASLCGMFWGSC